MTFIECSITVVWLGLFAARVGRLMDQLDTSWERGRQ